MKHIKFEDDLKFLVQLITEISDEQTSEHALKRLVTQCKKWHGFHTPTGIILGGEKPLAKMGVRSILRYQVYINTQLSISDSRTSLENDLLKCLVKWTKVAIFATIAQENPDKASLINSADRDSLVIKADETTGDWWLLVEESKSAQAL